MSLLRCPKFLRCLTADAGNFDRGHSLTSLPLPPAARSSLPTASVRTDLAMTAFLHGVWCVLLWCVGAGLCPARGRPRGSPLRVGCKGCGERGVGDAAPYGRIIADAVRRADVGIGPYGRVCFTDSGTAADRPIQWRSAGREFPSSAGGERRLHRPRGRFHRSGHRRGGKGQGTEWAQGAEPFAGRG